MDGERGQQPADVARLALRALGPRAVADQLFERGSALVAAEFVDRHGGSVPPGWAAAARGANDRRLTSRTRGPTLNTARRRASAGYRDTACAAQALRQARYLPHGADRSRRGRRLDDRRVSLLRDRSRTPGIDRARRPARGPAHRLRRRRPRGRRHQPLRLRPARARARRRARGRRLVAGGARRRDLRRGRPARGGAAGHAAAGAPQPLAIHSSGLGSVHLLKPLYEQGVRVLCLHPLQTFAGEPDAGLLRDVPCAVTALEERDLQLGEELAGRLGMRPFRLADEQKTLYHLSAVVGCNLLVALESEAKRLMDEATGDAPRPRPPLGAARDDDEEPAAERRAGVRAHRAGGARRHRHRARAPAPARPREPAAGAHVSRAQPGGAHARRAAARRRAGGDAARAARGGEAGGAAAGGRPSPAPTAGGRAAGATGPEASRDRRPDRRRGAGGAARAPAPSRLRAHHGRPARRAPQPGRGGAGALRAASPRPSS